jgi:3-dehydroquinate synthase
MSDLKATVSETQDGFHVEGYEKIEYDFTFIDGVFDIKNRNLADCYSRWGRVLAVTDLNIYNVYGKQMQRYFDHYDIDLRVHKTKIGEKAKTIPTFLSIVDSMTEFGIYRKVGVFRTDKDYETYSLTSGTGTCRWWWAGHRHSRVRKFRRRRLRRKAG